jgi:chromosome partitioning protein
MIAVIAFVRQKDGVGKSTLAHALAREGTKGGLRVKLADLDTQQGTSVDWHRVRLVAGVEPVMSTKAYTTAAQALSVAPQYDLLILDGPARTSAATLEIARN